MIIGKAMTGRVSNHACTLKAIGQVCENQNMVNININHTSNQLLSKPILTDVIIGFEAG